MRLIKLIALTTLLIGAEVWAQGTGGLGVKAMHQHWRYSASNPRPTQGRQIPGWQMASSPVGFQIQIPSGWLENGNGLNMPWIARSSDGLLEVSIIQNWQLPPRMSVKGITSRFLSQISGTNPEIIFQDSMRDHLFTSLGIVDGQNGIACFTAFRFLRNRVPTTGVMTFLITADSYVYTSGALTYVLAPANRFDSAVEQVFAPMGTSFWSAIPGGGERDTDGNGVPDSNDRFPYDPTRW